MTALTELTTMEDWEHILEKSNEQAVMIIKHSTACPISADAWEEVQAGVEEMSESEAEFVFVKVIESRPVSQKIADDIEIKHESPQAILVKNKKAVWDTSHSDITKQAIQSAVRS
ncbi:bacillithiol system redox-active protein YtxJ [Alteribacillus bidgolensis]|uniref:Bacillithiol system protein YtxJ n=1 Tax=Alteribacillus bidgolensis TaxID=930129 RepID=A0A1G8CNP0_9BACI|nr:bacillithiol system redox-active protein YtxJ [Alteribacillus bidgolensis]SDH46923.1 bacillithiol system protein YtxJ [Alteribacillus bidgolensis]